MRVAAVCIALVLVGCKKPTPITTANRLEEDLLVKQLRSRVVPNPSQAKLSVKMRSKPLGIAAPPLAGGLIVDRPGRAYLAILDPIGSPVLTLTSDGTAAAMTNTRDKEWIHAEDAQMALGSATEQSVALDDVISLLMGLVPVEQDMVKDRTEEADGVRLDIDGPGQTSFSALVDATNATPKSIRVDNAEGEQLVLATYEPFELQGDSWMPTNLLLEVPSVELTINVRYKTWKVLETAPDVFNVVPPKGYTVVPMEAYVERMSQSPEVPLAE